MTPDETDRTGQQAALRLYRDAAQHVEHEHAVRTTNGSPVSAATGMDGQPSVRVSHGSHVFVDAPFCLLLPNGIWTSARKPREKSKLVHCLEASLSIA
jgi:hypothetical protein